MSPLSFFTVKAWREGGSFAKGSVVREAKITRRNRFATVSSSLVVGWMCTCVCVRVCVWILCPNRCACRRHGARTTDPFPEKLTSFLVSDFSLVRGGEDVHHSARVQSSALTAAAAPPLVPLMDASLRWSRWAEAAHDINGVCSHAHMLHLLEEVSLVNACGKMTPFIFFSVS